MHWVERTAQEKGIECQFFPAWIVGCVQEFEASKRAGFEDVHMVECAPQRHPCTVASLSGVWGCSVPLVSALGFCGMGVQEFEASKRAGFEDVHMVECDPQRRVETLGADFPYALCFPSSADFHPLMSVPPRPPLPLMFPSVADCSKQYPLALRPYALCFPSSAEFHPLMSVPPPPLFLPLHVSPPPPPPLPLCSALLYCTVLCCAVVDSFFILLLCTVL